MSEPEYQRLWKLRRLKDEVVVQMHLHAKRRAKETAIVLEERGIPIPELPEDEG